jgi:hypothetical protein
MLLIDLVSAWVCITDAEVCHTGSCANLLSRLKIHLCCGNTWSAVHTTFQLYTSLAICMECTSLPLTY